MKRKTPKNRAQLEFGFDRPLEQDRNFHLGGKSFYFFDFDDNIAFLATPILLFDKINGQSLEVSSGEFAKEQKNIGKEGKFSNYFLDFDDVRGSFRHFRDIDFAQEIKSSTQKQKFVQDMETALSTKDFHWKAPSWNCFYHATHNHRPVSLITARGHREKTIKSGIELMVRDGHIPHDPNYLTIFPVSHPETRVQLGDLDQTASVPDLKRMAIKQSVEKAISQYGPSPFHRFGMSDDDPKNVELITEEMKVLKRIYPEMSFFVIQTYEDGYSKNEVLSQRTREVVTRAESNKSQLNLF